MGVAVSVGEAGREIMPSPARIGDHVGQPTGSIKDLDIKVIKFFVFFVDEHQ